MNKNNKKNLLINARLDMIGKKIKKFASGITLTNNAMKDIMNIIKSLEDRGILLK